MIELGAQPGPCIRKRKQRCAGRIQGDCRIAAEILRFAEEVEATAVGQLAEITALGAVAIEVDGDGGDGNRLGRRERLQRLLRERLASWRQREAKRGKRKPKH